MILLVDKAFKPLSLISRRKALEKLMRDKAIFLRDPDIVQLKYRSVMHNFDISYSKKGIFLRDEYVCQYCAKRCSKGSVTIDHILPTSRGGISSFLNCVAACRKCNEKKADMTPAEAKMKLLRDPKKPTFFYLKGLSKGENILREYYNWLNASCSIT